MTGGRLWNHSCHSTLSRSSQPLSLLLIIIRLRGEKSESFLFYNYFFLNFASQVNLILEEHTRIALRSSRIYFTSFERHHLTQCICGMSFEVAIPGNSRSEDGSIYLVAWREASNEKKPITCYHDPCHLCTLTTPSEFVKTERPLNGFWNAHYATFRNLLTGQNEFCLMKNLSCYGTAYSQIPRVRGIKDKREHYFTKSGFGKDS